MKKRSLYTILSATLCAGLALSALVAPVSPVLAKDNKAKETVDLGKVMIEKKDELTDNLRNALAVKESADKDETVYVITDPSGNASKVIVSDRIKNAEGKDTVTRSDSDKALPVSMKISYTLDGKEIDPAALAGKSGHVKMTVEYKNDLKTIVNVNGKNMETKVPFAAVSVFLLNTGFKNVTVTRGSVSSDGTRTFVCCLAFPGLENSLKGISEDADRVVVEADVEDFKLLTTVTVVTDEIFRGLDSDSRGDREEIGRKFDKLESDCTALVQGTATLADALGQLSDGTTKLNAAVGQLDAGAKQLTSNNGALVGGSEQIFASVLKTAYTSLNAAGVTVPELTSTNYATVLNGTISALNAKLAQIPAGTDTYVKVATGVATVKAVKEQLDSVNAFCTGLKTYTEGVTALETNLAKLSSEVEKLDASVKQIRDGAVTLSDAVENADLTGIASGVRETVAVLENSTDTLHAMFCAADSYSTFSGLDSDRTGTVRFVYRTGSIGE